MKRQSGFTLIELIIVIVILGILAVTVAPQFFNFGSDARASTVRALEGSIKTASDLVHARAQINTQSTDPGGTTDPFVEIRVGETALVDGQYAKATAAGIGKALSLGNGDWSPLSGTNAIAWHPSSITKGDEWTTIEELADALAALADEDPAAEDIKGCYAYYIYDGTNVPAIGSVTTDC